MFMKPLKDNTGTQLQAVYNYIRKSFGTRVMFLRLGEAEKGDAAEAENGDEAENRDEVENRDAASSSAFSAFMSLMSVSFMRLSLPLPACFMAAFAAAAFMVAFALPRPLPRPRPRPLDFAGMMERSGDGGSPSHDKRECTHAAACHHTCGAKAACRAQPLRP